MRINIFGIPSSAGALHTGTELSPGELRNAGLVESLQKLGFEVHDYGDLIIDMGQMPRHNVAPIRNWPGPRIVWEGIYDRAEEIFKNGEFTILLGGDCSIEVGSFSAFESVFGANTHLIVLDGHVDTIKPSGNSCVGAAGMGLWFLLQDHSMWWNKQGIDPLRISIIGPRDTDNSSFGMRVIPLSSIREEAGLEAVRYYIESLPKDAKILVHLDVDIFKSEVMPGAYSPDEDGLDLETGRKLLRCILSDSRVMGIEVSEFSPVNDPSGRSAGVILDLLGQIGSRKRIFEY